MLSSCIWPFLQIPDLRAVKVEGFICDLFIREYFSDRAFVDPVQSNLIIGIIDVIIVYKIIIWLILENVRAIKI